MPSRQLGHAALEILTEDWAVPVLRDLLTGPRRPSELEARLPSAPHAAVMRRLRDLHAAGVVTHEREPGLPPQAHYGLTAAGRRILDVVAAATRWEREWADEPGHGTTALKLIADERVRQIILILGQGPNTATELQTALPGDLARSTLRERLTVLVRSGVLRHAGSTYELSNSARALALIEVVAARWQWEWGEARPPVDPSDVASILHLFAPVAQLPAELGGVCKLQVEADDNGPTVYLAAEGHRLATLGLTPEAQPDATCCATPYAWCNALLSQRWCGLSMSGDRRLVAAMLASVGAALAG